MQGGSKDPKVRSNVTLYLEYQPTPSTSDFIIIIYTNIAGDDDPRMADKK